MEIEVLPTAISTKYLGRALSFCDPHRTELENRIAAAWKKFYKLKQELTGARYSLNDRLRLFHGTVTPTILYGAEAWTLTTDLENRLRRTQRQMLRMILHAPRRKHNTETQTRERPTLDQHPDAQTNTDTSSSDDNDVDSTTTETPMPPPPDEHDDAEIEPWSEWIKRSTREAETRMSKLRLEDWVTMQRRRKWRWARKLVASDEFNWATATIQWDPTIDPKLKSRRRPGRPKTRWADDIRNYILHTTTINTTNDDATTSHGTNNTNTQCDNHNRNKYEHQSALTKLPTPPNNDVWLKWASDKSFWETHEDEYAR